MKVGSGMKAGASSPKWRPKERSSVRKKGGDLTVSMLQGVSKENVCWVFKYRAAEKRD